MVCWSTRTMQTIPALCQKWSCVCGFVTGDWNRCQEDRTYVWMRTNDLYLCKTLTRKYSFRTNTRQTAFLCGTKAHATNREMNQPLIKYTKHLRGWSSQWSLGIHVCRALYPWGCWEGDTLQIRICFFTYWCDEVVHLPSALWFSSHHLVLRRYTVALSQCRSSSGSLQLSFTSALYDTCCWNGSGWLTSLFASVADHTDLDFYSATGGALLVYAWFISLWVNTTTRTGASRPQNWHIGADTNPARSHGLVTSSSSELLCKFPENFQCSLIASALLDVTFRLSPD